MMLRTHWAELFLWYS